MAKAPRLDFRTSGTSDRLIVLVHGIRQDARGMNGLAAALAALDPNAAIATFDYDWTQSIAVSGAQLAAQLKIPKYAHIDIVGYSMGGLVARRAIAEGGLASVRTVITLASPNRGAVTPAMLRPIGQEALGAARYISPKIPAPGVIDLTTFNEVMITLRQDPTVQAAVEGKRYASVPALYYHPDRPWRSLKSPMGRYAMMLGFFTKMPRPHDGVVSEERNDVTRRTSTDYAEFDFAKGDGVTPALCHAPHLSARDLDHMSILESPEIASLVARLLSTDDWTELKGDPNMRVTLA